MFQSSELRSSVYSFQKSVENKEVAESRHEQDRNRYDSAIRDLACRKISDLPYGMSVKKPLLLSTTQVGLPTVGIDTIIDSSTTDARRDRAIRELKNGTVQDLHKKMMSRAYDFAKEAKTAKDPCANYQTAAILFDNIMMYSKAIQYYNLAVKIVDPFAQVDNVLLPYTDLEMRKIERLGKVQRKRYLKNRDEKRESLILQEEVRQEKRLQDCYSRLFRVHLILAAQEMSPVEGEDLFTASSSSFPSSSSKPRSSRKAFSSSSISSAKSGMSSTVPGGGGDRQIIEENLLKAHISLRAAFRAFHPQRMEAYVNILVYAHDVLIKLLPPSSPEDGIYHHAVSGSAGPLPEAHIIILQELVNKHDPENREYYDALGKRYAEKCDFESAQKYFKISRDLKDANKTPRYDSSVSLYRNHGDIFVQKEREKELSTRKLKKNEMTDTIGTSIPRTDLLQGHRLAVVKIPVSAFGLKDEEDVQDYRDLPDHTYFRGKHEGSETRIYMPPSSGWDSLPDISKMEPKGA